jgi:hypothetical protein
LPCGATGQRRDRSLPRPTWLPDGRSWVNSSSMSELGIVAGSHPLHDASRQIPLQRLGARFVICKNISRPFCDSRMSFVACEVPDSLLAEKRAFGADHVRRHLVPPLARERRQRVDVEGVRPTGARM